MENNNKRGLTDADISRIWDSFRSGEPVETIAKDEGIKAERVERVTGGIMEVFEDDVPKMIADRKAGMTKAAIADKYGYTQLAVRYYLHGVRQGTPQEPPEPRLTFADDWNATCRRLNPKAWEGRT